MLNRQFVAKRLEHAEIVAGDLHAAEHAFDDAVGRAGRLLTSLSIARRESAVAAEASQEVLVRASASIASLVVARNEMIEAHRLLADFARTVRIDPTSVGPFEEKSQAQRPPLSVAA